MGAREYTVNIVGLTNQVHHFDFEMGNDFFERYGSGLISEGSLEAEVTLDKRETFIDAIFSIRGTVKLVCDRSLDPFDEGIRSNRKLVFKYGDSNEEISDEIVMIQRDTERLELGQYIFEFIVLELPMKRLHPRFRDEEADDDSVGKIIYTSKSPKSEDDTDGDSIDPRWEKLKKLK